MSDLDLAAAALRSSKGRVLAAALMCAAYLRELAADGDPVAASLVQDLDAAFDEMRAERIGAASLIAERTKSDDRD